MGATGIGVSVRHNAIEIDASSDAADAAIAAMVAARGVPTAAVLINRSRDGQLTGLITEPFGPAVPGGSGIYYENFGWRTCTMSANAKYGPFSMFITASHCSKHWGVEDITGFHQGATTSAAYIGEEVMDPTWFTCYVSYDCRYSDAAYGGWMANSGRYADFGRIAATTGRGTSSLVWAGYNLNIETVRDGQPLEGEVIDRIGGATGWQYGIVSSSCHDHQLTGRPNSILLCQTIVEGGAPSAGDSGGPAFTSIVSNVVMYEGVVSAYWSQKLTGKSGFFYSSFDNMQTDLGGSTALLVY